MSKSKKPFHDDIVGPSNGNPTTQAYLDQVAATIRDAGWAMQAVRATEHSDIKFDYVYTIGLIARNCTTELLIAGLPYKKGAEVINQIAMNMLNRGQLIAPAEWPLKDGFVLKSKTFAPRVAGELHIGVARAFYGQDVVVTQYVWPDANGLYPWDEGWDVTLLQPVGNR